MIWEEMCVPVHSKMCRIVQDAMIDLLKENVLLVTPTKNKNVYNLQNVAKIQNKNFGIDKLLLMSAFNSWWGVLPVKHGGRSEMV